MFRSVVVGALCLGLFSGCKVGGGNELATLDTKQKEKLCNEFTPDETQVFACGDVFITLEPEPLEDCLAELDALAPIGCTATVADLRDCFAAREANPCDESWVTDPGCVALGDPTCIETDEPAED